MDVDYSDDNNVNTENVDDNDAVQRSLHGDQQSLRSHGFLCKHLLMDIWPS
jgi:hypothetical protein